ncbi:MAG: hypothetical protein ACJ8H8_06150 [Geminicoccaceae bacterium]
MSEQSLSSLEAIVAAELAAPAAAPVVAIAEAARAAHGQAVGAVLFYGSCRREGYREGQLVDLYLLVDDYAAVHGSVVMRWLNRLVPPNVYYLETNHAEGRVRAKYALVSLGQFERRMGSATLNPYFWARFAQPTGLLWSRDRAVGNRVRAAMVRAIRTTADAVRPLVGEKADAATLWTRALAESYRTELRAEKLDRAKSIITGDLDRYRRVTAVLRPPAPAGSRGAAKRRWLWRRIQGKALSILRLAKASLTFAGGADYLAWKISRHAGVPVDFRPWERRHPVLAAPLVLWRLTRRGIVR